MTASQELIDGLIAGGMLPSEAAVLLMRAAMEISAKTRTPNAIRQQRHRDAAKALRSVTNNGSDEALHGVTNNACNETESVTKRYESVTNNAASLSIEEKKEEIKEKRESRACQLADDWHPNERTWTAIVETLGSEDRAKHELRKFRLHALDKGRIAKNWNAALQKWAIQAIEYESKRNGTALSDHRADQPAGRATAREAHAVTTVGSAALRYLKEGNAAGPERPASRDASPASGFDPDRRRENHH